jgi:hypothetical protein
VQKGSRVAAQAEMTFREMNLKVFTGEPIPHVLFQPRLEPWYDWQGRFGSLPEEYARLGLAGFYDQLRMSMRYVHYYTGVPDPVGRIWSPEVKIHEDFTETEGTRVYDTPWGELVEKHRFTVDATWREVGFPVKGRDDLRALRWLFERVRYSFSLEKFDAGSQFIGSRGEPQFWVPKSPYQALAQQWMKLEDLVYAIVDCPAEVEATMDAIDASYDPLYEQIIGSGRVRIVNFGENIHDHLFSPRYFERYLVPFFEKRSGQLRGAGIFTHVHIDGYFHSLLPYLKDLPFDGYEALTPLPQGDVLLGEVREHIGDKVLLDGIPAVMFLPTYSREVLMQTVEQLVALFHPRLVLGVSDEVPEAAPAAEAAQRLGMISDWCLTHGIAGRDVGLAARPQPGGPQAGA